MQARVPTDALTSLIVDMNFTRARTLVLLVPLLMSACSSTGPYQIDLMPTPDIYSEAKVDPFRDDAAQSPVPYEGILYATDRQPAKGTEVDDFYENERGHVLRLGVGKIQLGHTDLSWDEARRISLTKNRGQDYPLIVTEVKELGLLDSSRSEAFDAPEIRSEKSADREFAALVNAKLAISKTKDVFVYIHGYKVVFPNPLLVSTELWHFLGYDGAFVAYAWPATPSAWAYAKDLETAAYSSRNLRLLLEYLAARTRARRIHVVAFSAGTRVAIEALGQLALLNAGRTKQSIAHKLRIGNVILIGSDTDRDIFGGLLEDGLLKVMERLTVYMSGTDTALGLSNFLFTRRRLGQVFRPGKLDPEAQGFLNRTENLVGIDATDAENASAGNGHSYFRESPWVSSDVLITLKYDLPPEERGLVRHAPSPFWTFPPDYVQRLRLLLGKRFDLNAPSAAGGAKP